MHPIKQGNSTLMGALVGGLGGPLVGLSWAHESSQISLSPALFRDPVRVRKVHRYALKKRKRVPKKRGRVPKKRQRVIKKVCFVRGTGGGLLLHQKRGVAS